MPTGGFLGLNPAELTVLAKDLEAAATEVGGVARQLDAATTALAWMGDDATRFRKEWGETRSQLTTLQGELTRAATTVRQNVKEQQGTSSR